MEPPGAPRPSLPLDGAFVVQVDTTAGGSQGCLHGRVEHIVSAQATHFHSGAKLLAFIQEVLTARQNAASEVQ